MNIPLDWLVKTIEGSGDQKSDTLKIMLEEAFNQGQRSVSDDDNKTE